jgi:hypothetical protein
MSLAISPAQRFLGKPVKQRRDLFFSYSALRYLSDVAVYLKGTDKDVLLSALTICYDVKDDSDGRKAFLEEVGPLAVNLFLRNKDEGITKQAIKAG